MHNLERSNPPKSLKKDKKKKFYGFSMSFTSPIKSSTTCRQVSTENKIKNICPLQRNEECILVRTLLTFFSELNAMVAKKRVNKNLNIHLNLIATKVNAECLLMTEEKHMNSFTWKEKVSQSIFTLITKLKICMEK